MLIALGQLMPVIIGITGGTGSGKTILARSIAERYAHLGVALVDQDSYYRDQRHLSLPERESVNYDEPAAIDHELLLEHLRELLAGRPIVKPSYCFASHTRSGQGESVAPKPIIVVEGLFALWERRIRALMALKIFVEADADIRFIRRLQRDVLERGRSVQSVVEQYLQTVRPMHQLYVEPTKADADLVVDSPEDNRELHWAEPVFKRLAEMLEREAT
jgi:uridine kinase